MKIIVPMAGRGSRLRPHTLTVPKPLIPIAGKPIVQRLVEDIAKVAGEEIEEVAFIIGDFGPEIEKSLFRLLKNWEQKEVYIIRMILLELLMPSNVQNNQ
jgi:glucose-1-phosphate thymidylyltransferase